MADKQRGRKGQNQNQDMNRNSGSNSGNNRSGQNQQTQNISGPQHGSRSGMGKTGNPGSDRKDSGNRGSR